MDIREFKRWLKKGYLLILGAIGLNIIAKWLNVATWYTFLSGLQLSNFLAAVVGLTLLSIAFMFIVYPIALGYLLELIDRKVRK